MRAMHAAISKAFAVTVHCTKSTIKATYSLSYKLPAPKCVALKYIQQWLRANACWREGKYTSWYLPPSLCVNGYCGPWCADFPCLETLKKHVCSQKQGMCVCT